jgi:hypothetical protein
MCRVASTIIPRGTSAAGSRMALLGRLYATTVPDPAGQCARPTPLSDGPAVELCDSKRAPCPPCVSHSRGSPLCPISAASAYPSRPRRRIVASATARAAPGIWQTAQDEVAAVFQLAPESVPAVWMRLRNRWEYGHAGVHWAARWALRARAFRISGDTAGHAA